jgi:hypothetical protein
VQSYKYSESELEPLSLIIIRNNVKDIKEIPVQIDKEKINDNRCEKELSEDGSSVNESIKKCDENVCHICNKFFTRKSTLQRHIEKDVCKNIIYKTENNITNINTSTSTSTSTNNNNTIIINLNINKPLPFDSDWDVSNIDMKLKNILLLSELKYTQTLEYILENNANLNVIIEDKAESGIVYKNDIEKFKIMKIKDIVDLSMYKLHKQLTIFHDEIKNNNSYGINRRMLLVEKRNLDNKYDHYKNEDKAQILVKEYITNIYNKKKDKTLDYCKDLLNLELDKTDGY